MAKLKRELTLTTATILGVSVIIGAGIYSLIGAATAVAGSGVWLSFVIAAIVALFTGLSYAELASMFPQAGSSFLYVMKGMNNKLLGFSAGWLILFETVIGAAAIAMAFGNYFSSIIAFPVMLAALGVILLFSIINLIGIKESVFINNFLFILEVGGLIIVIALGFLLGTANPNLMDFEIAPVLAGASLVFFAMLGFEMIATESEEAKDAKHSIPYAMVLSILICAVLYALFSIAALMLVSPEILGTSTAPVKDIVYPLLGQYSFLFSFIALASTGSTILVCLITASRLSYGMAKNGALPKIFSRISSRFHTPHFAVLLALIVSAGFLLLANMVIIAEVTNFAALLAFFLINLSVISLRLREPKTKRAFKIPFSVRNVPIPAVLGAVTSLGLILMLSQEAILYGMGVTVLGGLVHLLMPKN